MRKMPHTTEKGANRHSDPDYAPTVEIFDNLTHEEIHAGVQQMNPVVLSAGQQAWQGTSTGLASSVEQAHTEIRAAIADGWRGGAAQTATDAVREFERNGQQLADVMAAVGQRLGQAGDAAEALRSAVAPAPGGTEPDLSNALLDPAQATENTAAQKTAETARQDVVQAMDSIYTSAFIPTGSGIPAFPDEVPVDATETSGAAPLGQVPTSSVVNGMETLTTQTVSASAAAAAPITIAEPAAATAPTQATTASAPTVAPVSATVPTVGAATPAKTVAAAADSPTSGTQTASTPTASTDRPTRISTGTSTLAASAAPVVTPTIPGAGNSSTDDERKRDERRKDSNSDAVNGMGAGAVGGLMGGALVAGDTPRSGPSTGAAARAAQLHDEDDDDDFHFVDDELTFLEPADDGGELIGDMEPTTPPVVGEWTELE